MEGKEKLIQELRQEISALKDENRELEKLHDLDQFKIKLLEKKAASCVDRLEIALKIFTTRRHEVAGLGAPILLIKQAVGLLKDIKELT